MHFVRETGNRKTTAWSDNTHEKIQLLHMANDLCIIPKGDVHVIHPLFGYTMTIRILAF